jgi:integrase
LPYLPAVVDDMVRLQLATGARPVEVCLIRPRDVDRSVEPWVYRPQRHKTEHHGRDRAIFVGPRAQEILRPYLLRDAESYCFVPAESEAGRKAQMRSRRKTKVQPSQLGRRKRKPKRRPGERYDTCAYRRAIARAAVAADRPAHKQDPTIPADDVVVPRWSPNRLRHSAATKIRQEFGLEAAATVLGHARADVTQIYAERDLAKAAAVMRQTG